MKIGIPRGLFYYYFSDLWINFFEYLGFNVVISPKTNKEILDLGIKYSNDEMCISLKNYIGHVLYLKDKVDYILVPRIDNYGRDNQTCTNFLALFDIINNLIDTKILNYNINLLNGETEYLGLLKIGKELKISKNKIKEAYQFALKRANKIRDSKISKNINKLNSKKVKILLIGHSYNIHDELISRDIKDILKKLDVEIICADTFYDSSSYEKLCPGLYFKYSKVLVSSIVDFIDNVDGIIFLSVFPCGVDSLVNELVIRKIDKPNINLVIDDNFISGGIETRLESFIDVINSR